MNRNLVHKKIFLDKEQKLSEDYPHDNHLNLENCASTDVRENDFKGAGTRGMR